MQEEKIKKICDVLQKQILEPAQKKAGEIIENAKMEAENIKNEANQKAKEIIQNTEKEVQRNQRAYRASLTLAFRQSIEQLKQEIEKKLFNENLEELIHEKIIDINTIKDLVCAIIEAIKKDGMDTDFSIVISKNIPKEKLSSLLTSDILQKLKEKDFLIEDFEGGIKIRFHKTKIVMEITEESIKDLIVKYIRKDFRKLLFHQENLIKL